MRPVLLFLPLLIFAAVPGCGPRDFRNVNDELRARVMELEGELTQLERRNRELEAELQRAADPEGIPAEAAAHVPQVAELAFARFSHARDTNGDGRPDEVRLYLHTLDGRNRFVQATGELTISAFLLPADPSLEPIPIGTTTLNPEQLRDALRSGFMGMHYSVIVPLSVPVDAQEQPSEVAQGVLVRAVLRDALTNRTFTADQTVRVRQSSR